MNHGSEIVHYSVWEPNEAERAALAAGENIRVGVWWIGGMPPISVGLTDEQAAGEQPDPRFRKPQPDAGQTYG